MKTMRQINSEEMTLRAGMEIRGGNLTQLPDVDPVSGEPCLAAWAGRGMGLFVTDYRGPEAVMLEAVALRDLIVCAAVLNDVSTEFQIGDHAFDTEGTNMTLIFVSRGQHFHFETRTGRGLRAVTILIDPAAIAEAQGSHPMLPNSLFGAIDAGGAALHKIAPGRFGRIAFDVLARRGLFAPAALLYYEGKALELTSTLLDQLSRQGERRFGSGELDPGTLERLGRVKSIIDQTPHRLLDMAALEGAAAMNRTKLRACFKQVYGVTLSDYRSALLLQRADKALKKTGLSVQQAAFRAGYANASSFIVAYKRHFGVNPGRALQQQNHRSADITLRDGREPQVSDGEAGHNSVRN